MIRKIPHIITVDDPGLKESIKIQSIISDLYRSQKENIQKSSYWFKKLFPEEYEKVRAYNNRLSHARRHIVDYVWQSFAESGSDYRTLEQMADTVQENTGIRMQTATILRLVHKTESETGETILLEQPGKKHLYSLVLSTE